MSGPTRLSGSLGRGVGAGQLAELRVGEAARACSHPGLVCLLLGSPAFIPSEHPCRPIVEVINVRLKHATHANTHIHAHLRKELHHSVSWSCVSSFCFRKLICMNQVTKPTSRRAGERKQMLFPPGRIELGSLSLWLNSASLKAQPLVKKKRKKNHDCSLSGFGSCSGLSTQSCSSQEKCNLSVADGDENRARGRGNAASGSLKALASFSQEGN